MVRTVKGVTLTPDERKQVGYEKIKTHTCAVTLPNGTSCAVTYTRWSTSSHSFAFAEPLTCTQAVYAPIPNGIAGIEAKAASLVDTLFQQAQQQEQVTMRQKAPSQRTMPFKDDGPQISARLADQLAGRYAACVQCTSGTLIRVGGTYSTPDMPLKEIQDGEYKAIRLVNGQHLVVGICNRAAQQWEVPVFLPTPVAAGAPSIPCAHIAEELENCAGADAADATVSNQEGDPLGGNEA